MQRRHLIPFLLLILLALPTCAEDVPDQGGELETDGDGFYIDVVDVNLINVEVFVTDKKGNPIKGLKKDDFVVLVDKSPMPVSNFYAVEDGTAMEGSDIRMLPQLEEEPVPGLPTAGPEVPEDQKLHLIIYVDNLNLHPFTRNKAFRFIRTFMREHLVPGQDEVMLVTYERSMNVRHPFTSDPELVASAMYEIETHSGMAVHFDSDRRDILEMIYDEDGTRTGSTGTNLRGRAITYAESIYNDMSFTLRALDQMVESLAGLPGRKAILHVSDGMSMRPGEDIFYALEERYRTQPNNNNSTQSQGVLMEIHRFDMSRDFARLTSKANANRVTFYTLEAAGLRTYSYMEAQNATAGGGAFIDQVHFSNLQNSLMFMANETGGQVIMNTNNFGPMLDRVANDFRTYYSLGITPGSAKSGRYHRIKVEMKDKALNKKYRVRHREGYRDKPLETRMADSTLAALHFGYQKNILDVQIEVGRGTPEDKGRRFIVPISVNIPIGKLSFLKAEDYQRGKIRLFIAARDDEGGLSPVQDVPIPIDIPVSDYERAKEQYYRYEMNLQMRQGRQVLAVGVHDEIAAVSGFVTRGISIGGS